MKHRLRPLRRSALAAITVAAAAFAGLATPAHAQGKAEVSNLTFDDIPSPEFQGVKNKSFKPKDWLEIEASMKIPATNADQKRAGYLNQVTVKWYIAVKNPDGKGVIKLTKTINHINVAVDEEVYSSVYLSPANIKRLTGRDKAGKSALEAAGLEVLVDGVKVGEAAVKQKEGWWNAGSLSDQSDKFPLLNKDETPFAAAWWDRYAEIQKER
jgi:hypothetical protein